MKSRSEIKERLKEAEDKLKRLSEGYRSWSPEQFIAEYHHTRGWIESLKWVLGGHEPKE